MTDMNDGRARSTNVVKLKKKLADTITNVVLRQLALHAMHHCDEAIGTLILPD